MSPGIQSGPFCVSTPPLNALPRCPAAPISATACPVSSAIRAITLSLAEPHLWPLALGAPVLSYRDPACYCLLPQLRRQGGFHSSPSWALRLLTASPQGARIGLVSAC